MSYNILMGGLVDYHMLSSCNLDPSLLAECPVGAYDFKDHSDLAQEFIGKGGFKHHSGGRLALILDVIRAYDPDILGIQEAHTWGMENEFIAKQVAESLGMYYTLGLAGDSQDPNAPHVALLSKFQIEEVLSWPNPFDRTVLRAKVRTSSNTAITVFVADLYLFGESINEIAALAEIMESDDEEIVLLLADLGTTPLSPLAQTALHDVGWVWIGGESVDSIWISSASTAAWKSGDTLLSEDPSVWKEVIRASERPPVAVKVLLAPGK